MAPVRPLILSLALGLASPAYSQSQIAFGGVEHDASLPIEVSSDQLSVDQGTGQAVFAGNVEVIQGTMSLTSDTLEVEYDTTQGAGGEIARLVARGGVTLVSDGEAAEADMAEYTIESGIVVMTGNVLLTQGPNAISADRMVIDLTSGTGTMDGRVRTTFQPGTP